MQKLMVLIGSNGGVVFFFSTYKRQNSNNLMEALELFFMQ